MLQLLLIRQIVLNEICNMFFSLPLFLRLNHPYVHVCLSAAFYVPLVFYLIMITVQLKLLNGPSTLCITPKRVLLQTMKTQMQQFLSRGYRGSYMSAHVLLNLLNELGKRDKMRGLPSILSLFRKEFNKFNNTRARMLDSIYHMTNTLKSHFWRKNIILSLCTQRCYGRHNVSRKSINH